jgi:hypothetical protein
MKPLNRNQIGSEVDEELRFHLDHLTHEHLRLNMSPEEARAAALNRFGNVEQIKDECVEISSRSHPLLLALKSLLILVFLSGVLLRVFVSETHVKHCGDILIAVGVLGRLWFYARGLRPVSLPSPTQTASPLMLIDQSAAPFAPYDQKSRTPVERFISR